MCTLKLYDCCNLRMIKFQRSELLAERNIKLNISNSQRNENTLFWKTLSILLDYLAFIINLVLSLTNFVLLIL